MKVDKVLKSVISKRTTFGNRSKAVQLPTFDVQDIENISPSNNRMKKQTNYNNIG